MKTTTLSAFAVLMVVILIASCSREEMNPKVSKSSISLTAPNYDYLAVDRNTGYLGRVLFYDKSLSVNNSISCASCHKQELAFSDHEQFSNGFENLRTSRNSPPIQNLMGTLNDNTFGMPNDQTLFWDGSETDLRSLVLKPITHRVEMGMRSPQDLVEKLRSISYYEELFNNAFGSPEITADKVSEALAGFVGSIESNKSRFDVNLNTLENSFSEMEKRGEELFFGDYDCGSCHQLQLASGYNPNTAAFGEMVNIGLVMQTQDPGFADVTENPQDHGKFKIPNLRNVALTAPYMHDGRFETLEEVIDHYSTGVVNSANLDARLMENGQAVSLNIPPEDKQALIAFLHTLTDQDMVTDPKYSNPFQEQ